MNCTKFDIYVSRTKSLTWRWLLYN